MLAFFGKSGIVCVSNCSIQFSAVVVHRQSSKSVTACTGT